jgi:hypothetical protein
METGAAEAVPDKGAAPHKGAAAKSRCRQCGCTEATADCGGTEAATTHSHSTAAEASATHAHPAAVEAATKTTTTAVETAAATKSTAAMTPAATTTTGRGGVRDQHGDRSECKQGNHRFA